MTRKDVTRYAPIAGAGGTAVALGFSLTGHLPYPLWTVALAFPAGAAAYLLIEFLFEKVGA